jgi:dihydroorotate dehydrogenase electron transfer subunit
MRQFQSEILNNRLLGSDFFELTLRWDPSQHPQPGQFLTIRVSDLPFPLLRRPFAFSRFDAAGQSVSIIVQIRGSATDILSRKKPGETLDIIGPLGNCFKEPESGRFPVLVAGGIGLGPMLFFGSRLRERKIAGSFVFGSRTSSAIPECEDFGALEAVLCTDDGSRGFHGTTVDYLESLADSRSNPVQLEAETAELYCYGPLPMLHAVSLLAQSRQIPCWVSMEQTMGCSMGACMGCVIKTRGEPGFSRVCTEGPVFDSREIVWT